MERFLELHFFQQELLRHLDVRDMLKVELLNKGYQKLLCDEDLWRYKAINDYGKKFWEDKDIESFRNELIKMEKFQNVLERITLKRWTSSDFRNCWHGCSVLRSIFNVG